MIRTFPTRQAAVNWARDIEDAKARGEVGAVPTVEEAVEEFLTAAERGDVGQRGGQPFKPSTLHGYRATQPTLVEAFGSRRLDLLSRREVAAWVTEMRKTKSPSTIRNLLMPLRCAYRLHDLTAPIPSLPSGGKRRDRIANPAEARRLLDALPDADRPIWTAAIYAGLRRGELMALRWRDVDLEAGVLTVRQSYDPKTGTYGPPKSRAGERRVPILPALSQALASMPRTGEWVFGRFSDAALRVRAREAWRDLPALACDPDGEPGLSLHEARHTAASIFIAAGLTPKSVSSYLGHSSVSITFDRYGHLFAGTEAEDAARVAAWLADRQ